MTDLRAAAERVIEAWLGADPTEFFNALAALRAVLAEPEQEGGERWECVGFPGCPAYKMRAPGPDCSECSTVTPSPEPDRCPTCGSTDLGVCNVDDEPHRLWWRDRQPNGPCCPDPWHQGTPEPDLDLPAPNPSPAPETFIRCPECRHGSGRHSDGCSREDG